MCMVSLQPIPQAAGVVGKYSATRSIFDLVAVEEMANLRRENQWRHADESAYRIGESPRVRLEIVVEEYCHPVATQELVPPAQMQAVAVGFQQVRVSRHLLLERTSDQALRVQQPVMGIDARYRLAQRADDLAPREVVRDALAHLWAVEVRRAYLADRPLVVATPEVPRVPLKAATVEHVKKTGFLDTFGQAGAMVKHAMQPGRPGSRWTDGDKIRQPLPSPRWLSHARAHRRRLWPTAWRAHGSSAEAKRSCAGGGK